MLSWFKGKKKSEPEEKKEEPKEESDNNLEPEDDDKEVDPNNFDPVEALKDLKDKEDETITDVNQGDYEGYLNIPQEKMVQIMMNFEFGKAGENVRHEEGYSKGGRICADQRVVLKSRSAGKEIIKDIGKKILTGSFNLTKVSFPIRVMIPKTALETAVHATSIFPLYISKAAYSPDSLERFKLVVTAIVSSFFWTNSFLKPLNPILGETLQAEYNDRTQVYVEQISHHPPVSYFLVMGPNKMYKYYGYYLIEAGAWLNSLQILSKGKRAIEFKDGQKIEFNFPSENYKSTFVGQMRQESVGKLIFTDKANKIQCTIEFGKVKKFPTDYFKSDIIQDGKKVSVIQGTYLGFIDIDNLRYWDYRTVTPYRIQMKTDCLESDHRNRSDLITLKAGDLKQAQIEKERLEVIQRSDRKLRETNAKKNKN